MTPTTTSQPPLLARLLLPGVVLLAALVPVVVQASPADAAEGACTDGNGVTVVVDFTDVGGETVTRCAPSDPGTGREALESAGFTPTDSQPGLICAIDTLPDPCPATFEGSFWSYWHSIEDGEWESYTVGADSSDPAPGELEGWRYNDGSVPPGITPTDAAALLPPAAEQPDADQPDSEPAVEPANNTLQYVLLGLAVLVAVAIAIVVVRTQRRRGAANR